MTNPSWYILGGVGVIWLVLYKIGLFEDVNDEFEAKIHFSIIIAAIIISAIAVTISILFF